MPQTPMPRLPDHLIRTSRVTVRLVVLANRIFFAALLAGLLLSFVTPATFAALLIQPASAPGTITGMRWLLLLGLAMSLVSAILLAALSQIVTSTAAGDPFLSPNASRLGTIAWALFSLQLLDIPAAFIARAYPVLAPGLPTIPFSPAGWLAVLMVFVLSRVFAAGSAMRDDLEGTV